LRASSPTVGWLYSPNCLEDSHQAAQAPVALSPMGLGGGMGMKEEPGVLGSKVGHRLLGGGEGCAFFL